MKLKSNDSTQYQGNTAAPTPAPVVEQPPAPVVAPVAAVTPAPAVLQQSNVVETATQPTPEASGGVVAVALPEQLPAPAFIEGTGEGFEQAGDQALKFPMLLLMQPQSPLVLEGKAKAGDIVLSTTGEVILSVGQEAVFSTFFHFQEWIEWGDKTLNEGMIARDKEPRGELAIRAAKWEKKTNSKGVEVLAVNSYHNFFICFEDNLSEPVCLPLTSTKFKVGNLLLQLGMRRGASYPIYAGRYSIKSFLEKGKSFSYFNYDVKNAGWVTKEEYDSFKKSHKQCKELYDKVVLNYESEVDVAPAPSTDM